MLVDLLRPGDWPRRISCLIQRDFCVATATLLFFSSSCSSKHRRSPKTWKSWLSRKSSHQARLISSLIGSSNLCAWKIGAALHPPPATYHDAPQEPVTQLPSCHFKMKDNKKNMLDVRSSKIPILRKTLNVFGRCSLSRRQTMELLT